jgi:hypothetical protein
LDEPAIGFQRKAQGTGVPLVVAVRVVKHGRAARG